MIDLGAALKQSATKVTSSDPLQMLGDCGSLRPAQPLFPLINEGNGAEKGFPNSVPGWHSSLGRAEAPWPHLAIGAFSSTESFTLTGFLH